MIGRCNRRLSIPSSLSSPHRSSFSSHRFFLPEARLCNWCHLLYGSYPLSSYPFFLGDDGILGLYPPQFSFFSRVTRVDGNNLFRQVREGGNLGKEGRGRKVVSEKLFFPLSPSLQDPLSSPSPLSFSFLPSRYSLC